MRGDFSADFEALQRDIGFYGAVECMGHELQYKKMSNYVHRQWEVTSHPTHLYNLCGHILSSVQIAKYLGITLTDELSWSCTRPTLDPQPCKFHPGLFEEEPPALSCQT